MYTDMPADIIALEDVVFEDVSEQELQDEKYLEIVSHYEDMREELGYQSVWSMTEFGAKDLDFQVIAKSAVRVRYQFVREDATTAELVADMEDGGNRSTAEVTSIAVTGTIGGLWRAAESCIKQSGTHHIFIEDFEFGEDGTLLLVTGS